jgi:hypothetical protein
LNALEYRAKFLMKIENKFSIAAGFSAAVISLGVATAPAQAGTITFNYYDATVATEITLNPLLNNFLQSIDFPIPLPTNSIPLNFDLPPGSFTLLDDPAQYTDGDITLDFPLLSQLFGISLPPEQVETFDNLFNFDFLGSGSIQSQVAGLTNFDINYDSAQNAFVINNFNPDVIEGCTLGICQTQASGNLGLSLVLSQFVDLSDDLGIDLTDDVLNAIALYQQFFGDELSLATGTIDVAVTTEPVNSQSVPEPGVSLGLLGIAGGLAARRKMRNAA